MLHTNTRAPPLLLRQSHASKRKRQSWPWIVMMAMHFRTWPGLRAPSSRSESPALSRKKARLYVREVQPVNNFRYSFVQMFVMQIIPVKEPERAWIVCRRFSDFRTLNQQVSIPDCVIAPLNSFIIDSRSFKKSRNIWFLVTSPLIKVLLNF